MLSSLKIENVAVIEKAEIVFDSGLNILTGETGAGKSIVIDSINAVLGDRVSREIVRHGAEKAVVTAVFTDVEKQVRDKLSEMGIESDDGVVIITRTISSDSRSNCKINGNTVTVSMLRTIGSDLITICGQHDSQHLLQKERHAFFVDSIADCADLLLSYRETFAEIKAVRKELKKLLESEDTKQQRMDFLSFQIKELSDANLTVGEKKRLLDEKKMFQNRERLVNILHSCSYLINGSDETQGLSSGLYSLIDVLSELAKFDSAFAEFHTAVSQFRYTLDDCSDEVSGVLSDFSEGSFNINEIEERLDLLYRLSRKYGESEEEMLSYLEKITQEYTSLEMSDEAIEKLQIKFDEIGDVLFDKACVLSDARKYASLEFEKKVTDYLHYLNMPSAHFAVNFEDCPANENGIDIIEFLFTANEGQAPKPLAKIASGGELSRVMLAIRCVLSDKDIVSTMIFDEIDTGVSGRTAQKIALKLSELSKSKQVICVTHLAQIAAFADRHLYIEKDSVDRATYTKITPLSGESRIREIARIIGGDIITETTLSSAKELIQFSQNLSKDLTLKQ